MNPKQILKLMNKKIFTIYAQNICLSGPMSSYLSKPSFVCDGRVCFDETSGTYRLI